jgi:hypothetical protein
VKWVCAIALCAVLAACDVFNPDSGLPMKGEALAQAQARAEHECRLWLEAVEARGIGVFGSLSRSRGSPGVEWTVWAD